MTSTKYLGYVGGAAVALGVGAAVAAAGQGTAHADSADTQSASSENPADNKGPTKKIKASIKDSVKAVSDASDKVAAATKTDAKSSFDPAKAVKNLQKQFDSSVQTAKTSLSAASAKAKTDLAKSAAATATALKSGSSSKMTTASTLSTVSTLDAAGDDPLSNPFRDNDPEPTDMPDAVLAVRDTVVGVTPTELKPVAREGVEAAYRVSQMVPWVNVVIPITKILPAVIQAAEGNKAGAQITINQLLLTTPPVSFLYYGYDELADLLNVEDSAYGLKRQFYAGVWDTLDYFDLLHEPNQPGI